jgi:hypothetical protein
VVVAAAIVPPNCSARSARFISIRRRRAYATEEAVRVDDRSQPRGDDPKAGLGIRYFVQLSCCP